MALQSKQIFFIFGLAFLIGCGLMVYFSRVAVNYGPIGMDVYVRWIGSQNFWQGASPYAPEVQVAAENLIFGRPALPNENAFFFSYPAYLALLLAPLLVLPIQWAALVWSAGMWAVLATFVTIWGITMRLWFSAWLWFLLLVGGLLYRPALLSAINGQYALFVLGCLLLSWFLMKEGFDGWAGIVLVWVTIKPSVGALLPVFIFFWALRWRRWRLLAGMLGMSASLFLITVAVIGWWVGDFIRESASYVPRYRDVALVWSFEDWNTPAGLFWLVSSSLLLILGLRALWREREFPWIGLIAVLNLNLLLTPHTVEYDLTMLLLPILWLGAQGRHRRGGMYLVVLLIWLPWLSWMAMLALGSTTEAWWRVIWAFYPNLILLLILSWFGYVKLCHPFSRHAAKTF